MTLHKVWGVVICSTIFFKMLLCFVVSFAAAGPMKYLHEVGAGPCDMKSGYGLLMAEQSGFPRSVLQDARQLRSVVRDQFPVLVSNGGGSSGTSAAGISNSVAAMTSLLQHLLLLKTTINTSSSDRGNDGEDITRSAAARQYLQSLRDRIPDSAAQDMLLWLRHNGSSVSANTSNNHTTVVDAEGSTSVCQDDVATGSGSRATVRSEEPPSKVPRTMSAPQSAADL